MGLLNFVLCERDNDYVSLETVLTLCLRLEIHLRQLQLIIVVQAEVMQNLDKFAQKNDILLKQRKTTYHGRINYIPGTDSRLAQPWLESDG